MFETNPISDFHIEKCYDHYKYNDHGYVWRKVFVVDNFYKNPDKVAELALSYTPSYDKSVCSGLIGGRVWEDNPEMVKNLKPVFEELCQHKEWYNLEWDQEDFDSKWDKMKFMVNVTTGDDINEAFKDKMMSYTHHKDNEDYRWAALIYLNDGPGGTNFYAFKEDWPLEPNYDMKKDIKFTSEMKYNRMVLYEARQTHGAILDKGMFSEYPRLAQVFFM
jgi:hypothetical protein